MSKKKSFACTVVSSQQVHGKIIHLPILKIIISILESACTAMRGERVSPNEKLGERHI
jgi:hypothetical protein